jgi:predicted O-linked N-acetylglucosamine transferase (SPINDLY family)
MFPHQNSPTQALSGSIPQALDLAIQSYQAGQMPQAAAICQQILQVDPKNSDALHGLGIIAVSQKNYERAVELIQQAITYTPAIPFFYNSLGNVYWYQNKLLEASHAYRQALTIKPDYVEAYNGLGNVLSDQGHLEEATRCYQRAITLNPNYAQAHNGLGNVLREQAQLVAAETCYQRAVSLSPAYAEAYNNLGGLLCDMGQLEEAQQCCQRALALTPDYAKAHNNLGNVLRKQFQFSAAIASYQRALALSPDFAEAYSNLGNVFRDKGMLQEAIEYHRKALQLKPLPQIYSSLLFAWNYVAEDNLAAHADYQQFNQRYTLPWQPHLNSRHPQRRLKIGYVSADFRRHSVAYFLEAILAHHDHREFEIVCYSDHLEEDEVTLRLRQYADQWVNCTGLTDEALAKRIREAQIDILVDLMGHTGKNRLLVFARKPAPVQVSYLGYPNTTGLQAIDYRITDNYADPVGRSESFSTETLVRLPKSYFCYRPYEDSPPVTPLPAIANGYLTFGSFNYYTKLSPTILTLWAKVLQAVPQSRLLIKSNTRNLLQDPAIRETVIARLTGIGLDPQRVILADFSPSTAAHLSMYQQVDMAFDSYPYNGATTTCEALWMGVPVVTLVGKTHASRMGLSILSTVGLEELIAESPEEYVRRCVTLARELDYLQQLREQLRSRLQASPLLDAPAVTRQVEVSYRRMWERWCGGVGVRNLFAE